MSEKGKKQGIGQQMVIPLSQKLKYKKEIKQLKAEKKWMSEYVEQAEGCNWRKIMEQALKRSERNDAAQPHRGEERKGQ